MRRERQGGGFFGRVLAGIGLLGLGVVMLNSIGDLKRYLRMKRIAGGPPPQPELPTDEVARSRAQAPRWGTRPWAT
jgi:hypothetical protein